MRDTKAIAVGYESVIREKELAFDAQLAATEIVRRCERRIGELVREGQGRGEIARVGDIGGTALVGQGFRGSVPGGSRGKDLLRHVTAVDPSTNGKMKSAELEAELEIKRLRSALAAVTCELADCYRLIGVLDSGQAVPGAMCLLRDLRRCRAGR